MTDRATITRETELPDILARYPACREIFDRYGLTGCGGPLGPREPVSFFARAHRVDEERLLAELNEAARTGAHRPQSVEYEPGAGDMIYRRFFRAAILTMFTFGCVLGGINLAIMAADRQLASPDMRAITWAHAHAQVAGWVTFFVMGFAYQAIPRFKFTTLWRPVLASRSLYVMAAALTVRTLADVWIGNPAWVLAGRMAGAFELGVVLLFVTIVWKTIHQSTSPAEPYERFILAALGWMIVAFAFDWWVFSASAAVSGYRGWVEFIGRYDAPWRDLQLAGCAGGMILGVSQRFLPFIYGYREVPARTSRIVFYLWNLGVAGNVVAWFMLVRTQAPVWRIVLELCILGMFASVAILIHGFGLFSADVERDRSLPFFKAAYLWALVALALLAMQPVYNAVSGLAFSHAYFGGYRHAFTVGFISMMILAVSSKIVPVLGGLDARRLSTLRATFWLVNIGNAMRVTFQILTDRYEWAYPVMGISAWVEVTGLALWAIDLWRAMSARPDTAKVGGHVSIDARTKVFDVIQRYPETMALFREFGFSMIDNPVAQRVFARSITLEQACRLKHVDFQSFTAALRAAVEKPCAGSDDLVRIKAHS